MSSDTEKVESSRRTRGKERKLKVNQESRFDGKKVQKGEEGRECGVTRLGFAEVSATPPRVSSLFSS